MRAARCGRAQIRGRWAARSAEGARTDRCRAAPQLGSTGYITDRTGQILEHEEYLPSGESWFEELKNGSANNRLPWQFNGKELDETGLYYYGARYYNPRAGVWMSPDPILAQYVHGEVNSGVFHPQNLGLYGYTWNNPVRLIDANGLDPSDSWYVRAGKGLLGIGYGALQSSTLGGFILDTAGTPSKDVDFLAGKGVANIVVGASEIAEGGGAVAAGVLAEAPSVGTSTVVVAGGAVAVAEGAANVAAGLNSIAVAIKGGEDADGKRSSARAGHNGVQGPAQQASRTTRGREKAVEQTFPDGSVKDISPKRVKEFVPNNHPDAPPGSKQKVKFPDAQPGSKGFKRDPTPSELEELR